MRVVHLNLQINHFLSHIQQMHLMRQNEKIYVYSTNFEKFDELIYTKRFDV